MRTRLSTNYDLNSRAKNFDEDIFIRPLFPPLPRTGERNQHSRLNRNNHHQKANSLFLTP